MWPAASAYARTVERTLSWAQPVLPCFTTRRPFLALLAFKLKAEGTGTVFAFSEWANGTWLTDRVATTRTDGTQLLVSKYPVQPVYKLSGSYRTPSDPVGVARANPPPKWLFPRNYRTGYAGEHRMPVHPTTLLPKTRSDWL
jgi:hypothetical protein